jgi:hypothetical protein
MGFLFSSPVTSTVDDSYLSQYCSMSSGGNDVKCRIFILTKTGKEINTTKIRKENNTGQNNNFIVTELKDTLHTVP